MADFETLSVKINTDELTLSQIDERAKELGMNRSQFVTFTVNMNLNFDRALWARITRYSQSLHIPEWLVIQNLLIARFAQDAGKKEVWGLQEKIMTEFLTVSDGESYQTITGEKLFEMIKQKTIQEESAKKAKLPTGTQTAAQITPELQELLNQDDPERDAEWTPEIDPEG